MPGDAGGPYGVLSRDDRGLVVQMGTFLVFSMVVIFLASTRPAPCPRATIELEAPTPGESPTFSGATVKTEA